MRNEVKRCGVNGMIDWGVPIPLNLAEIVFVHQRLNTQLRLANQIQFPTKEISVILRFYGRVYNTNTSSSSPVTSVMPPKSGTNDDVHRLQEDIS